MSLKDELAAHRDLILAELDRVHDYFTDSKVAWRLIQRHINRGGKITIRNLTTGHVTTEAEIPDKAQFYVTDFLAAATFQQFVALFEEFIFGVLRQWLFRYPKSLARKQLELSMVLHAVDLNAVKLALIDRELNELKYTRVRDWFQYLENIANLGRPTEDEIGRLAEIKASRDIHVHNRGVASEIYETKAGAKKRFSAGERVEIPEHYHRESWEFIRKIVVDVSDAAIAKL